MDAFIDLPQAFVAPLKMFVFDTVIEILRNEPRHFSSSFLNRYAIKLEKYNKITKDCRSDDILALIAIEYSTRLKEFDRQSLSRMDTLLQVMSKWNGPQKDLVAAVHSVTTKDFQNIKGNMPIVSLEYLHDNGVDVAPFVCIP